MSLLNQSESLLVINEVTKSFAEKIVDKNFKNFVGKDIDILE